MRVESIPFLMIVFGSEYRRGGQDDLPNLGERHQETFFGQDTRNVGNRTIFQRFQGGSDHLSVPPLSTKPSA